MKNYSFKVNSKEEAIRIDKFIILKLEDESRSFVQKLIKDKNVLINSKPCKKNYILSLYDNVEIEIPKPKASKIKAEKIDLDIVYEDDSLLVVNKKRGMVVHPAPGNYEGTLVNALLGRGGFLSGIGGEIRPGIVHRIDKATTGLLIVAKNDKAHRFLSDQLKDKSLSRIYYAIVHGNIKEDRLILDFKIARHKKNRKKMSVDSDGKEALTICTVLERFGDYSFVKLELKTGRTHQIRVHLSHINRYILGDKDYGIKNEKFNLAGQLLHAAKLKFIHPETKDQRLIEIDLPDDFKRILNILRENK